MDVTRPINVNAANVAMERQKENTRTKRMERESRKQRRIAPLSGGWKKLTEGRTYWIKIKFSRACVRAQHFYSHIFIYAARLRTIFSILFMCFFLSRRVNTSRVWRYYKTDFVSSVRYCPTLALLLLLLYITIISLDFIGSRERFFYSRRVQNKNGTHTKNVFIRVTIGNIYVVYF